MKKINYYYLVAGFLALLFSITHELNGQRALIPALYAGELDINTVTTFKYMYLQPIVTQYLVCNKSEIWP